MKMTKYKNTMQQSEIGRTETFSFSHRQEDWCWVRGTVGIVLRYV